MSAWRTVPTLAGRHVTLRPLERGDRAGLLAAFQGLEDITTTLIPTESRIDAWHDDVERQTAAGRMLPFTVLDADGVIAGMTRFMRMAEWHRRVEIGGTVYARRVWRTGLNTEAKRMLLTHAFDVLGCLCVQLRTHHLNFRSQAAIERLGAHRDGMLRGHLVMADGHVRNTIVYSILDSEWPAVRANLDARMAAYDGGD